MYKILMNILPKDIGMINKHIKYCSRSFVIREIQIKPTMTYYFIPNRIFIFKRQAITIIPTVGKDTEKMNPYYKLQVKILIYIPIRIAKIKSSIHTNVIKNVKELQFLNTTGLNVKWYK